MNTDVLNKPIMRILLSTGLCLVWALLFWWVFLVQISWNILKIPMGLGGALYFLIFILPVAIGSLIYQLAANEIIKRNNIELSRSKQYGIMLGIPFCIISILLIVYCPMDIDASYIEYVLGRS